MGAVLVRVGGVELRVPTGRVREVAVVGAVTPVPSAPARVLGLMQLRGQILPLAHLGAGRPPARPGDALLVLEEGGVRIGLVVDEVLGVSDDLAGEFDVAAFFDGLADELQQAALGALGTRSGA